MNTGPNIEIEGLLFGYDTNYGVAHCGLSTRFYKGRSTTNISATHHAFGHNTGNYGNDVTVVDAPEKGDGWKKVTIKDRGNNFRILQWQYTGHSPDVVYSHSAEFDWGNMRDKGYSITFDGSGGGSRNYFRNGNYTSNEGSSINGSLEDGHFASNIIKSGGTHVHAWFIYHYSTGVSGLNDYFYYRDYQVEAHSVSSPYTSSERSSTESLVDLKRTTNIDVSNMSFDSTGQPVFDGTDDVLSTGLFSGRNPSTSPFTIEAIVKSDTTSGSHMWLDVNGNGSGQRLYCAYAATGTGNPMGIQSSGWSSSGVNDTDFHHYVITMNGNTATLYNNGTLHSTKSYTSYTLPNNIQAGGRGGYSWLGRIPVFKVYDQVLTTDQIKQNFNAYKTRFDI